MKRKRVKKIKWLNVIKLAILLGSITFILHDLYMLTLHSWFTGELLGWTWFRLLTFITVCGLAGCIVEDFNEQMKKSSSIRRTQRF